MYINNYYLWIFCCNNKYCSIQRDFIKNGKIWKCLINSMELLLNFDIILITEWMNDIRSNLFVNKIFFNNKLNKNIKEKFSINSMNYPFPYHIKNRGRNLMLNNEFINILIEYNKWDIIFYNFAKHIAYNRMHYTSKQLKSMTRKQLLSFKDNTIFKFDAPKYNTTQFIYQNKQFIKQMNKLILSQTSE